MKYKKSFLFTMTLGFLLIITGVSYAFFSYANNGSKMVSITTDGITFRYKEGTNHINLNNAMPMDDEFAMYENRYFEFEITGSTPENIVIPYNITARKSAGSSDIDENIKIGLTKLKYNEEAIYASTSARGSYTFSECQERVGWYWEGASAKCVKIHNAGDSANNVYQVHFYMDKIYDSYESCKHSITWLRKGNWEIDCVEKDGQYVKQQTIGEFNSLEQCENSEYFSSDTSCIRKYDFDTFNEDMYTIEYYVEAYYNSLEECEKSAFFGTNCTLAYEPGTLADEEIVTMTTYDKFSQYENDNIDLSKYTEKLLLRSQVPADKEDSKTVYRLRVWIDEDTDFTQEKYNGANFSLTINVYSEGKNKIDFVPGLYDDNDFLLASWDELVNDYGLDVETDYYDEDVDPFDLETYPSQNMLGAITQNNPTLLAGTKLVLGNVSKIGGLAFFKTNLKTVQIPSTVTSIGNYAFFDNFIESLTVPDEVTTIADRSFDGIEYLTYHGPAVSTDELAGYWGARFLNAYVENHIIYNNESKTELIATEGYPSSVIIPASVKVIKDSAFFYNNNLKSVTFEENSQLTTIEDCAFNTCKNLTSIELPATFTTLGKDVFERGESFESISVDPNNPVFTSVDGVLYNKDKTELILYPQNKKGSSYTIPASVTTLAYEAFYGNTHLTNIMFETNSQLTTVGNGSFLACTNLETISIPASVTYIGNWAFSGCSNLKSVTFADNSQLLTIDDGAFNSCASLAELRIPSTVTNIGYVAFNGVPHVYYTGSATGYWGAEAYN